MVVVDHNRSFEMTSRHFRETPDECSSARRTLALVAVLTAPIARAEEAAGMLPELAPAVLAGGGGGYSGAGNQNLMGAGIGLSLGSSLAMSLLVGTLLAEIAPAHANLMQFGRVDSTSHLLFGNQDPSARKVTPLIYYLGESSRRAQISFTGHPEMG